MMLCWLSFDVFLVVPTGYGKSLVYGFLFLMTNEVCVTLARLRSYTVIILQVKIITCQSTYINHQADKFTAMGLRVGYIGEGQHDSSVSEGVLKGRYQLVFISPENIVNDTPYRNMLLTETYQRKLVALAIDEAHCVQTW